MTFKTLLAAALTTATLTGGAQAEGHGGTIVDIAAGDERFSTLVAAVTAAGLVETLQGEGPFTVYAPLNDAFAALPEGTVDTLLMPENKEQLTNVLLYHVDEGKMMAGDFTAGTTGYQPVLASDTLCITAGEGVMIDDGTGEMANVVVADIEATNGVIHVIDKVLMPGNSPACG